MASLGFMELLVLLLLGGDFLEPDVLALVPPRDYFAARKVETTPAEMMKLVAQEPKDAKTQVKQLLALRQLAAEPEELKKAKEYAGYRETLEQVAAGKKYNDTLGFAREYAQIVLARLDGKEVPPTEKGDLRDALKWFPADATLVGAVEIGVAERGGTRGGELVRQLWKMVPPEVKEQVYQTLEKTGNIRLERLAGAYVDGKPGRGYLRLTGRMNQDWIADALKAFPILTAERVRGPFGEPLLLLKPNAGDEVPNFVLVGNRDLFAAGYLGQKAKSKELIEQVLKVRADKQPNARQGGLKDRLNKLPRDTVALLVGDMPNETQRVFFGPGVNVQKVDSFIERTQPGFDVNVKLTTGGEGEAQKVVEEVSRRRKEGIAVLQQIQQNPPRELAGVPFAQYVNLLQSLQAQSEGAEARIRLLIPHQIIRSLPETLLLVVGGRLQPPPGN